jgi:hypothetical protein
MNDAYLYLLSWATTICNHFLYVFLNHYSLVALTPLHRIADDWANIVLAPDVETNGPKKDSGSTHVVCKLSAACGI